MSDITKVLRDDHARMKRLFLRATKAPQDLSIALDVCDELTIHSTIEEELVYPILRELDANLADESEDEHEEAKELIAEIEDMDGEDAALRPIMTQLKKSVLRHAEKEEETIFPVLERNLPDQLLEMGSQAFAMRQELLGARPPRSKHIKSETANMGWGNRRGQSSTTNMGF